MQRMQQSIARHQKNWAFRLLATFHLVTLNADYLLCHYLFYYNYFG